MCTPILYHRDLYKSTTILHIHNLPVIFTFLKASRHQYCIFPPTLVVRHLITKFPKPKKKKITTPFPLYSIPKLQGNQPQTTPQPQSFENAFLNHPNSHRHPPHHLHHRPRPASGNLHPRQRDIPRRSWVHRSSRMGLYLRSMCAW